MRENVRVTELLAYAYSTYGKCFYVYTLAKYITIHFNIINEDILIIKRFYVGEMFTNEWK